MGRSRDGTAIVVAPVSEVELAADVAQDTGFAAEVVGTATEVGLRELRP